MTEVLDRTSQTAPELLALCDLAANEQDYLSAYHHASMAYRAAVSDIEQNRQDPTIACEAARRACWLSAKLNYSEMSTIMWVKDGVAAMHHTPTNATIKAMLRIYETGVEALGIHNKRCVLGNEYYRHLQRFRSEANFWKCWLQEPRWPLRFLD